MQQRTNGIQWVYKGIERTNGIQWVYKGIERTNGIQWATMQILPEICIWQRVSKDCAFLYHNS